jgi:hypothetical protein
VGAAGSSVSDPAGPVRGRPGLVPSHDAVARDRSLESSAGHRRRGRCGCRAPDPTRTTMVIDTFEEKEPKADTDPIEADAAEAS